MSPGITILDALATLAWLAAVLGILVRWRTPLELGLRPAFLGLCLFSGVYSLCMLAEWSGLSTRLEHIENVAGATLPIWWLLAVFSVAHRSHVEAIEGHSQRQREIFNQSLQLMGMLSTDGRMQLANDTALEFVGDTTSRNIGIPLWETDWWSHSPALQEELRDAIKLAAAGESIRFEATHKNANDQIRDVDFSLRPMRDSVGNVRALIAEAHDITELKAAEKERQQLREELLQSQKMEVVGQLAGGVAHDFNNLLTVILGNAQILRETTLERETVSDLESAMEAVNAIDYAAEQGASVTRSLLTFGHKASWKMEIVDLAVVVKRTAGLLRRLLPNSISFKVSIADDAPFWLRADETQLQQLIMNLAINGRDAMPDGGELHIKLDRLHASEGNVDEVLLTISDTGVGIPEESRDLVFEPFYTTKERGKGTGLGLAVVRSIVADHDAQIELASELEIGSTFQVSFAACSERQPQPVETARDESLRGNGERVLLAEGNTQARDVFAQQLQSAGYSVTLAENAAQVRDRLSSTDKPTDIVVIDADLPGITNKPYLDHAEYATTPTPAIVLTNGTVDDVKLAENHPVAVLHKPFRMPELVRAVFNALNDRHRETENHN